MYVVSAVKSKNGTTQLTVVPHICTLCKKAFLRRDTLLEHLKCHQESTDAATENTYSVVTVTHEESNDLSELKIEVPDASQDELTLETDDPDISVAEHGKTSQFFCKLCNRTFANKAYFNKHIKLHDGLKSYTCGICDKSFSIKDSLLKHCKIHDPEKQRFFCPECHKGFTSKQYLQKHELIHRGVRPHACNVCGKAFTLKTNLNKHFASLHSEEKLYYMCELCNRGFSSKAYLEKHHLIHVGERPHVCGVCFKAFTLKTNLHKHYLTHTGYRKFGCDVCYKRFKTKGALDQHYYTHSGDRPFACEQCPRTFKQRSHLLKHIQLHNGTGLEESVGAKDIKVSENMNLSSESWRRKMRDVKTIIN